MQTTHPMHEPGDWAADTIRQINQLPEDTREHAARNAYARQFVRSIEIMDVAAPRMWIDGRWPNAIFFRFTSGERQAEFKLNPKGFSTTTWGFATTPKIVIHHGWPGEVARGLFSWLYPGQNHTVADEMFGLCNVKKSAP